MVDRVVEEQHLRRLDDDRRERQETVVDELLHAVAEAVGDPRDDRLDDLVAEDRQRAAEDADAEVVDQHLEAWLHLACDGVVEQLQEQADSGPRTKAPRIITCPPNGSTVVPSAS